jgi:16S rRNA (guanine966-N2)-methyltransferase
MSLRIISGALKGRKLKTLRGTKTRPTTDRLRETIFNILQAYDRPQIVLDLFAGSGAFGLEAISRGAKEAVFIDGQRTACNIIKENIRICHIESQTTVIHWNIIHNLHCIRKVPHFFDLVFMDPPYNQNCLTPTLNHLLNSGRLKPKALIVLEHHENEPLLAGLPHLETIDCRRYGKTLVSILYYMV